MGEEAILSRHNLFVVDAHFSPAKNDRSKGRLEFGRSEAQEDLSSVVTSKAMKVAERLIFAVVHARNCYCFASLILHYTRSM